MVVVDPARSGREISITVVGGSDGRWGIGEALRQQGASVRDGAGHLEDLDVRHHNRVDPARSDKEIGVAAEGGSNGRWGIGEVSQQQGASMGDGVGHRASREQGGSAGDGV